MRVRGGTQNNVNHFFEKTKHEIVSASKEVKVILVKQSCKTKLSKLVDKLYRVDNLQMITCLIIYSEVSKTIGLTFCRQK